MKTRLDTLELYRKEKIVWNDAQKMYGQNIFSLSPPPSLHAIPKRKCFFNNFNLAFKPLMVSGREMSPGWVSRVHVSRGQLFSRTREVFDELHFGMRNTSSISYNIETTLNLILVMFSKSFPRLSKCVSPRDMSKTRKHSQKYIFHIFSWEIALIYLHTM